MFGVFLANLRIFLMSGFWSFGCRRIWYLFDIVRYPGHITTQLSFYILSRASLSTMRSFQPSQATLT